MNDILITILITWSLVGFITLSCWIVDSENQVIFSRMSYKQMGFAIITSGPLTIILMICTGIAYIIFQAWNKLFNLLE